MNLNEQIKQIQAHINAGATPDFNHATGCTQPNTVGYMSIANSPQPIAREIEQELAINGELISALNQAFGILASKLDPVLGYAMPESSSKEPSTPPRQSPIANTLLKNNNNLTQLLGAVHALHDRVQL